MSQFFVLFRKEMLELWRSYKWLWVPLVFLSLGIIQPAATYYLPQILDSFGGLPEGTIIEIPQSSAGGVLAESLSQLGTIGLLVLVLAAMGVLVAERRNGVAAMLLVKPVAFSAYVSAKWAAYVLLTVVSILIGQIGAWYYTTVLFGDFPLGMVLESALVFAVWMSFILTALLLISVFLRSAAPAAFAALILAIVLSVLTPLFEEPMIWSPVNLSVYASTRLVDSTAHELLIPLGATLLLMAVMLLVTIGALRRRQLAA
ncbi:MAG: ABC transporter permease [Alphaproteobacteria bacterium]